MAGEVNIGLTYSMLIYPASQSGIGGGGGISGLYKTHSNQKLRAYSKVADEVNLGLTYNMLIYPSRRVAWGGGISGIYKTHSNHLTKRGTRFVPRAD